MRGWFKRNKLRRGISLLDHRQERRRLAIRQLWPESLEGRVLLTAVTNIDPPANAHDVSAATDITATFDQNIDPTSATVETLAAHLMQTGQLTNATAVVTTAGAAVTVSPSGGLLAGELVYVTATSGLQSLGADPVDPFVWQFRAAVTGGSGTFVDSGQVLGTGTSSDVALGDLDGDGDLDAFVANTNASNRLLWNQGGQFTDSGQALGDHNSISVSLGDLDGDGDLDAFVGNAYEADRIWINDGGVFSDSGQLVGSHATYGTALGDLDGDGDLDAFTANRLQGNRVWLNDGGVLTGDGQSLGNQNSFGVALGDVDGDGDLDAFVANNYQQNRIWLNTGGQFTDSGQLLGNHSSYGVSLGDLDGDGDLDAFVANYYEGNRVWLNFGGIFVDSGQALGDHSSYGVSLGDLDGDGDLDAFVANSGQGNQVWSNSNGQFSRGAALGSGDSFSVDLGDLDLDGDLDAFAANFNQGNRVWLNESSTFVVTPRRLAGAEGDAGIHLFEFSVTREFVTAGAASVSYSVEPSGANPAAADDFAGGVFPAGTLNFADGVASLPIVIQVAGDTVVESDEEFRLRLSSPSGGTVLGTGSAAATIRNDDNVDLGDLPFPFRTELSRNGPAHVATGPTLGINRDVEPDGQPSAAADADDSGGAFDDEDGVTFAAPLRPAQIAAAVTVNASGTARLDAWIDFNGDGSLDQAGEQIFTSRELFAGDNTLFFAVPPDARQGQTFARFRLSTAGGLSATGGAADGEVEDHVVSIANPIGRNQFGDSGQRLGNEESSAVALGDLDGDGDLDAYVAVRYSANRIYVNQDGTFVDSGRNLGDYNSTDVALGDLDGDGDLDAFVTNAYEGNRVWVNDGGQFADAGQILGDHNSYAVSLGDFDADGDLDAFVANAGANRVWVNEGGQFTDSGLRLGTEMSRDVAVADLNGDGYLDAVVANDGSGNQIWINSSGTFVAGQQIGDHRSVGVALGDLDGDGDLDALFANYYQGNRVWLNASGSFADSGQTLGNHDSAAVALGDVDGDGDLDAYVASYSGSNRIWLNNAGSFRDSGQMLGDHFSTDVALGDVDGDGDIDAFTANSGANLVWANLNPTFSVTPRRVAVREGNSGTTEMTFTVVRQFDTSGTASVDFEITLEGVDPAELDDFVGGALPSGTLSFASGVSSLPVTLEVVGDNVIENDESLRFTLSNPVGQDSTIGNATSLGVILNDDGLDLGDLPAPFPTLLIDNGPAHFASGPRLGLVLDTETDGRPSASADGDDASGVQNDEEGVVFGGLIFAGQVNAEVMVTASEDAKLDAWIDFNRDGNFASVGEKVFSARDVVAGDNVLRFHVPPDAQQGPTFARFRISTDGGLPPTGIAADGEVEDYQFFMHNPVGSRTFVNSAQSLGTHSGRATMLGDLDGDGDLDAFVANSFQPNRIWLNNGGVFEDSGQTLGNHNSYGVALGDLDGDGDLDAFVANSYIHGNRIWLNDGGTFTDSGQSLGINSSVDVKLGDFDGDGDLDAFVANAGALGNRVWLNQAGIFSDSGQVLGASDTAAVALGDVDGDGDLDAFAANTNQPNRVWLNSGGIFADSEQSLGDYRSSDVALGDLDGDGDPDAIVTNYSGGSRVWENEAGVFTDSGLILGSPRTRGISLGDLDGDGDLDAFVANSFSGNQVWWNYDGVLVDSNQNLGNHATSDVSLGDVDGDGDLDAFTSTTVQGNRVWINQNSLFDVSPLRLTSVEGDAGVTTVTLTVSRDNSLPGAARVGYLLSPAGIDGVDLDDFAAGEFPSGTLFFDDQVLSLPISFDIVGDTVVENDEGFTVVIGNREGTVVRTSLVQGVIRNDDNVDLGDLPSGYPTLLAENGPAHIAAGPTLGAVRDADGDGQPSSLADGDDNSQLDDEDGVRFESSISAGQSAARVTVTASDLARLDAWIDFNGDGSFDAAGEQIFSSRPVNAGENFLTFGVPANATAGEVFARFRLSSSGGLAPVGGASDGEVEDHRLLIDPPSGSGVFLSGQQSLADNDSFGVALGDLDGDGDLDAFVANHGAANRIWLNTAGTFSDSGQALGNGGSVAVALGDLDRDGDLDAFVVNDADQGNRVWLNEGGVFLGNGQSLGQATSLDVALGDLDGDGDLDAFVANANQNRIWINQDGLFTDSGQLLGQSISIAVALGDLDGDGDLDAFVGNNELPNRIWWNEGGRFTDSLQQLGNHATADVALGDLDGDGDLDGFVTNRNQGNRIWFNDGGSFSDSGQELDSRDAAVGVLGDVDGDGDLDAFVANRFGSNIVWFNQDGQFSSDGRYLLGGHRSYGAALGDLDGDGDLDAFVANYLGPNRVWVNQNPTFTVTPTLLPLREGNAATTAFTFHVERAFDVRGAATVDFAFGLSGNDPAEVDDFVGGTLPSGRLQFGDGVALVPVTIEVLGDTDEEGDEGFSLTLSNPIGRNSVIGAGVASGRILNDDGVDLGDLPAPFPTLLDDDGAAHLAVGPRLGDLRDTEIDGQPSQAADGDDNSAVNDEDGVTFTSIVFAGQLAAAVLVNVSQDAKLDAWIDFNGDRSFDSSGEQIFTSRSVVAGNNELAFAVPAGALPGDTFARFRLSTAGGLSPTGGAPDGEVEDYSLTIAEPFNGGLFESNGQSLGDHSSLDVALGDVDGDGDLDAFVANTYGEGNRLWINDAGQFTAGGQILGNHDSYAVALGDLDGDGDLDAFVANGNQQANRVWLNDGGLFSDSGQLLGDGSSFDVALGDLDRDGDLDAFVANSYAGNRVWLNQGGVFTDSSQVLGGSDSLAVALGDLDGDGDLDAFVANYAEANRVWLNDQGRFSDSGQGLGDHRSWGAALGDLDGDGDLDAIIANADNGDRIWLNGGGTFSDSGQLLGDHFSFDIALGDLDGDGDLDAFVGSGHTTTVMIQSSGNRVLFNEGGVFTDSGQGLGENATFGVALGDVDGDGDLDAFAANYYPVSTNQVWLDLETRNLVSVTAEDANKLELDSGTTAFTFLVTRSGDTTVPTALNYEVSPAGAHPADADDFGGTLPSGSVNFGVSVTSARVTIEVAGDTLREFPEEFAVTLTDVTLGSPVVVKPSAIGRILNDDGSPALHINSLTPTSTGFVVEFNEAFDATVLNQFETLGDGWGPADVVLSESDGGVVTGSVVLGADRLTFIKTDGPLDPGDYTVRLRSAADGFKNAAGVLLDGNGDGLVGDDFQRAFSASPAPAGAIVVSVPNFVRGPGQAVNLPANTAAGLPLALSDGTGVRSINLELAYDPAMLTISSAMVAPGLPAGAAAILNNTIPGRAVLTFFSPVDLPAGAVNFVNLGATIPSDDANAVYRGKQVVDLRNIVISNSVGVPFATIDDDALHVAAFFADVSGNGRVNASDAARVGRIAALLDSGFEGSLLVDPMVVGDISGNGRLNAADASRVARFAALLPVSEVPPLPTDVFVRPTGGPDPRLSIPQDLVAAAGSAIRVPLQIDSIVDLQAPHRLVEIDAIIQFDNTVLTATSVSAEGFLLNQAGWSWTATIDNTLGQIVVVAHTAQPVSGLFSDVVVDLHFAIDSEARPGRTAINLAAAANGLFTDLVDESDGALELDGPLTNAADDPVDGVLTIVAPTRARAPSYRSAVDQLMADPALPLDEALHEWDCPSVERRHGE